MQNIMRKYKIIYLCNASCKLPVATARGGHNFKWATEAATATVAAAEAVAKNQLS